jgi:predicted MFS family arabinose efflux permease
MRLKIQNRINTIPITLYFIWCLYLLYFYLIRIKNVTHLSPMKGYLINYLPVFALFFILITLIIMLILNQVKKKKLFSDFIYIFIVSLILIAIWVDYLIISL